MLSRVDTSPININFMTLNIACLPTPFGKQLNAHFLDKNSDRLSRIIEEIGGLDAATPDIISFQEVFDYSSLLQLCKGLKEKGYHSIATSVGIFNLNQSLNPLTINVMESTLKSYFPLASVLAVDNSSCLMNPGGLLIASKKPILDSRFVKFDNAMLGEETIAKKGVLITKIDIGNKKFITYANTHLHAGGALFKELSSRWGGTTSYRRGEQMGSIHDALLEYQDKAPENYREYKQVKTVFSGDFNASFNHDRHYQCISSGSSQCNGFKKGNIKYYGQALLFQNFLWQLPENFLNVRTKKSANQKDDFQLIKQAQEENKFTGSSLAESTLIEAKQVGESKLESQHKLIDILNPSDFGCSATYRSRIHSFGTATDHHAIIGKISIDVNSKYQPIRHTEKYKQGFFDTHRKSVCLGVLGTLALLAGTIGSAGTLAIVIGAFLLVMALITAHDEHRVKPVKLTKHSSC